MEKWTADDEPVVKLSSYLRLHELRGALFGFVKIADGDARGETLERRPASLPPIIDWESPWKKREDGKEEKRDNEIRESGVFLAAGSIAKSAI